MITLRRPPPVRMFTPLLTLTLLLSIFPTLAQSQSPHAVNSPLIHESSTPCPEDFTAFPQIHRVAIIGAGPSGLQAAAAMIEHGKDVRLFERAPDPGGNWNWTPKKPVPAPFPNKPLPVAAYTPDIPSSIPSVKIYKDGEDGISSDWRIREHWNPSPVWNHLRANSHPSITSMPGVKYPEDTQWDIPNHLIKRHMRSYASLHGLNSNDLESNITSYSTRVERVLKSSNSTTWTLTLRKLTPIPYSPTNNVRIEYWNEEFDAVLVASGPYDAPWVPASDDNDNKTNTPGLADWANAYPEKIYHARAYRDPAEYVGKNVLLVGGSVSASEIARDLAPWVGNFSISIRPNMKNIFRRRSFLRLPKNITHLPVIESFPPLPSEGSRRTDIRDLELTFENGVRASEFDEIIFCTGYRRSMPFLEGLHNTSITSNDRVPAEIDPILTDGKRLHSLHWTGHYIPDPTLAFITLRPYTLGSYQALGIAKTWSGKARLPSTQKMWEQYPGAQLELHELGPFGHIGEEATGRLWVAWLNSASLEFGGRLVDDPLPFHAKEEFIYFAHRFWEEDYIDHQAWLDLENTPRSQWPRRTQDPVLPDV